jgi:hypothetical protein
MSVILVLAGAVLLWPVLRARHGRAVVAATLIALLSGTVAWGIARGPGWSGAAAFAIASALVRIAFGRRDDVPERMTPGRRRGLWLGALGLAAVVLAAKGAGIGDVLDGLFSSWSGLLWWSPILWLAVAGSVRARSFATSSAVLPALLVAAAVGAVTMDAGPFRGARFAPVLPLLALGLARAFDALRAAALRRPLLPVGALLAVLAAWNGLLMGQYRDGRIPRDDTVAFPRIARNAAATVSATFGTPTAWPANWIYSARHGVSPARYDLLGGVDLFGRVSPGGAVRRDRRAGPATLDIGHLPTDEAMLRGGWSVRHPCGIAVCRAIEGAAEIVVPLRETRDLDLTVVAFGEGTMTVAVNGVPVLQAPLGESQSHSVRVAGARFRRGLNSIVLAAPGARVLVDGLVFAPVTP